VIDVTGGYVPIDNLITSQPGAAGFVAAAEAAFRSRDYHAALGSF
jgi:hypothetical protein